MVRSPCTRLFPVRSVPPSVPQSLCESPLPKYCSFSYAFNFYLFTFLPFYFLKGRFAQNYKKIYFKIIRPSARNYFLTCNSHVINHEFFYNFLIQFFYNFEAVRPTHFRSPLTRSSQGHTLTLVREIVQNLIQN